jgi:hypothetical protein
MIITIFQKPDMKIRVAKAGINYPWVHGVDSMPLYPYRLPNWVENSFIPIFLSGKTHRTVGFRVPIVCLLLVNLSWTLDGSERHHWPLPVVVKWLVQNTAAADHLGYSRRQAASSADAGALSLYMMSAPLARCSAAASRGARKTATMPRNICSCPFVVLALFRLVLLVLVVAGEARRPPCSGTGPSRSFSSNKSPWMGWLGLSSVVPPFSLLFSTFHSLYLHKYNLFFTCS